MSVLRCVLVSVLRSVLILEERGVCMQVSPLQRLVTPLQQDEQEHVIAAVQGQLEKLGYVWVGA